METLILVLEILIFIFSVATAYFVSEDSGKGGEGLVIGLMMMILLLTFIIAPLKLANYLYQPVKPEDIIEFIDIAKTDKEKAFVYDFLQKNKKPTGLNMIFAKSDLFDLKDAETSDGVKNEMEAKEKSLQESAAKINGKT